ncbi:MAG: hypothetical protein WA672_09155, partial [Candidatus Angelobacter sp.]
ANGGSQAMNALWLGIIKHFREGSRKVSIETPHTFFQQSHVRGVYKQLNTILDDKVTSKMPHLMCIIWIRLFPSLSGS